MPPSSQTRGTARLLRLLALLISLALLAAACNGNDEPADEPDDEPDVTAPDDPADDETAAVDGCEDGFVDPSEMGEDRPLARCQPGFPQPQPLDEPAEVVITSAVMSGEYVAPLLLAEHFGEFEAENLQVTLETMAAVDAYGLIGRQAGVDAAYPGVEAGLFNAIASGFDLKMVTGNFFPHPEEGRTGLWSSTDGTIDPDNPDIADLAGGTIASGVGMGSVIMYPLAAALEDAGISITDVNIETIPFTDMVVALEQGAVQAAWVLDPFWVDLVDNPETVFLAGQPPGEPLGGLVFGPRLLEEEPEVGEAVVRAFIRTISTYLPPDYHDDEEIVQVLAELMDSTPERLTGVPPSTFDWELRQGTGERTEQAFFTLDVLDYDEPMGDDIFDRSFYMRAVGAQ